ncbi:unnamed protein product [Pleuronectes platessa]|uniref:Uncharacterized protein n=1 Tax=Pleuronectes platessa TaxID=8262 RepID=A0A9N7Z4S1_PLEPL|nr:unnamed protein product [Pleuronectes platessa]
MRRSDKKESEGETELLSRTCFHEDGNRARASSRSHSMHRGKLSSVCGQDRRKDVQSVQHVPTTGLPQTLLQSDRNTNQNQLAPHPHPAPPSPPVSSSLQDLVSCLAVSQQPGSETVHGVSSPVLGRKSEPRGPSGERAQGRGGEEESRKALVVDETTSSSPGLHRSTRCTPVLALAPPSSIRSGSRERKARAPTAVLARHAPAPLGVSVSAAVALQRVRGVDRHEFCFIAILNWVEKTRPVRPTARNYAAGIIEEYVQGFPIRVSVVLHTPAGVSVRVQNPLLPGGDKPKVHQQRSRRRDAEGQQTSPLLLRGSKICALTRGAEDGRGGRREYCPAGVVMAMDGSQSCE